MGKAATNSAEMADITIGEHAMTNHKPDTDQLVAMAADGDTDACDELFDRHRDRLRHMVTSRLDRRLAARVDPSDVVQEAMAEAAEKLPTYHRTHPLPFYPWLRKLAWDRLVELHRWHFRQKRSVGREEPFDMRPTDESVHQLAGGLIARQTSAGGKLVRRELVERAHLALDRLEAGDREILLLRQIEQLSTSEAASVLSLSVTATKSRHFRAMQRLLRNLGSLTGETEA